MIDNSNYDRADIKDYSGYYLPQKIGPGALSNDKVKRCYICNESIQFRKRPDNKGWQLLDYFTGRVHIHKDK